MTGMETLLLTLIIVGVFCFVYMKMGDRFRTGIAAPYYGYHDAGLAKKCGDNVGRYYEKKYKGKNYYNPLGGDTKSYYQLKAHQETLTHEDLWKKRMDASAKRSYTSNVAKTSSPINDKGLVTNADINHRKIHRFNQIDNKNTHPAMQAAKEGMANTSQLNVSDLLPDPCMNKGKDWTNVFSECENLVGGQNFVKLEDEHFTNQVLDTRCTKLMSLDLRKPPAIQYADVSIWNKPSVCKNIYEYIRPSLDSDC